MGRGSGKADFSGVLVRRNAFFHSGFQFNWMFCTRQRGSLNKLYKTKVLRFFLVNLCLFFFTFVVPWAFVTLVFGTVNLKNKAFSFRLHEHSA